MEHVEGTIEVRTSSIMALTSPIGMDEIQNLACQIEQEYPGVKFPPAVTREELERFVISASQYMGGEKAPVEGFLSRWNTIKNCEDVIELPVWGVIVYTKERVDRSTGEALIVPGIIFKLIYREREQPVYISFESASVARFLKSTVLLLRPMGNWDRPLYMSIRNIELGEGKRTYGLQLLGAPL